jgi:hypothetical protein
MIQEVKFTTYEFTTYGYVDAAGAEADVTSIAANGTHATAGQIINVEGKQSAFMQLKATGHAAGSSGVVEFYLSFSADGTHFSTAGTQFVLTLNAASAVVSEPVELSIRGVKKLKVLKIMNKDTGQQVDTLNAIFSIVMG